VDYSRVEIAVDARRRVWSCGLPLRMPCNKADMARSARSKSNKCRHEVKMRLWEKVWMLNLRKN